MNKLSLGYSPCPNDTFIFYALVHGKIPCPGIAFEERLEDVETLNRLALEGLLDLTKISYHAYGHLRDQYALLHSGGALGRGCGPLVIAPQEMAMDDLRGQTIAVPGRLTTANLLLQLHCHGHENLLILPFEQIMPAVQQKRVAAGVIIHESRFTYQQYGLHPVLDLGQWWEEDTGHPIPLGGILAKRSLGKEVIEGIDCALKASIEFAYANPDQPGGYIRQHAQELDEEVVRSHIGLYVNDFSLDLGNEGIAAINCLFTRAEEYGIIPPSNFPLFAV